MREPTGRRYARREISSVALHHNLGQITAIHRTFLTPDGNGKAQVTDPKMALGSIGDGAVRLATHGKALGLAEGIETALSAMQLFGIPVWAVLGQRHASVALPDDVIEVQIFADNGEAGLAAANEAADIFTREGKRICLRPPPSEYDDWNDALQALKGAA